jgi:hypothetical protein
MVFEGVTAVSFLDVPEPDDLRWKYLSDFGVVVESGADQFIQCLRQLKISSASIKQASELYRQIQGHSVRDGEMIRYLICYISFSESELMESMQKCLQSGGTCIHPRCKYRNLDRLRPLHLERPNVSPSNNLLGSILPRAP